MVNKKQIFNNNPNSDSLPPAPPTAGAIVQRGDSYADSRSFKIRFNRGHLTRNHGRLGSTGGGGGAMYDTMKLKKF